MAQEIYHRSEWGNPNEQWGNVYLNADLTNELYKRASEYENSWVTDQLLNGVGTKPSIIMTPTAYEDGKLNSVKPAKTFGSELVTNGGFDTDSDWSKSASVVISDGKITTTVTSGGYQYFSQSINYESGKQYKLIIKVNGDSGFNCSFYDAAGNNGGLKNSDGLIEFNGQDQVIELDFIANNNSNTILCARSGSGNFSYSIDSVSVKEVIDADFDFTRGSSATRVNEKGLIQDVQILSDELVQNGDFEEIGSEEVTNGDFEQIGSELVTNGDFSNGATDWVVNAGITITDKANFNNVSGAYVSQDILTAGKSYKLTFDITDYTSGNPTIFGGAANNISTGYSLNAVGSYTIYFTPDGTFDNQIYFGNFFTGSIDNVSVKEVGQDWEFYNADADTNTRFENNAAVLEVINTQFTRFISTTSPMTIGKFYKVTYEVTETDGTDLNIQYPNTSLNSSL